jgi:hypothetical protein
MRKFQPSAMVMDRDPALSFRLVKRAISVVQTGFGPLNWQFWPFSDRPRNSCSENAKRALIAVTIWPLNAHPSRNQARQTVNKTVIEPKRSSGVRPLVSPSKSRKIGNNRDGNVSHVIGKPDA